MNIGTLIIKDMKGTIALERETSNITLSGGRIYIQIDGAFMQELSLQKNTLYKLQIQGVAGMESPILASYEDYIFNAGSTETIDQNGALHAGVCVLSNQLQFLLLS